MKIHIKSIREGAKFSGAYIKILKKGFVEQAEIFTEEQHT